MVKRRMYQRKLDVEMLNAVKSVLADVSSISPPLRRSAYPHQPYVDTLYALSIPFAVILVLLLNYIYCLFKSCDLYYIE